MASSRGVQGPRASQPAGANPLQSHVVSAVERQAQAGVGVGDPQVLVDQAVGGGLQLGGIVLRTLGARGMIGHRELSSE